MIQNKIKNILKNKTNNIPNIETYPYLQKSIEEMTSIEKVQTILYNGQETNYLILTVEAAKKHLECDIGYEAQLNKKEYVALEEDSGTYTWYGFNDESNWKNLAIPANIEEQITEQDAEYLLLHGALKSK